MQYSTDFAKVKNRRGFGMHQGGYETENAISPDNMRNEHFKFQNTYDSGFEHSDGQTLHEGMTSTQNARVKRKKYTYMTLKTSNDHKSRSVSSNLGRMDHTCFI